MHGAHPDGMKRSKVWRGRHGGWSRLGVSEPVNEFDRRPFEHPLLLWMDADLPRWWEHPGTR
jgi:hypothetical protein